MSARRCLREPIPTVFDVARYLDAAVSADLNGDCQLATELLKKADHPGVRSWLESVWGKNSRYGQLRKVSPPPPIERATPARMPTIEQIRELHRRDGYSCRYCGIPVIRAAVRKFAVRRFPGTVQWGRKNSSQHAGFQALWAQYDHVVPHSWGGTNDVENLVIACAACNFGKMSYSLEELGLEDPRAHDPASTSWDGLERWLLASNSLAAPSADSPEHCRLKAVQHADRQPALTPSGC